jgi:uncharacterized membrane protein YfcA
MLPESWPEYAVAFVVVILIGISKAGFAGGTGVLATPLFCLVVDPRQAVGVLLPVLCACDWVSLYYYRRSFALRPLLLSLPGGVAGIAAGSLLLGSVSDARLRQIVGSIALVFVLDRVVRVMLRRQSAAWTPGAPAGALLGGAAGFFSTLAHAAGPILAAYLLPQKLGRQLYVGTSVVFFVVINHLKLIPYAYQGLLESANLTFSLVLLPVVPLGVWLGVWLNRRMSERAFLVVVYALLFLTGLKLLGVPTPLELVQLVDPVELVSTDAR